MHSSGVKNYGLMLFAITAVSCSSQSAPQSNSPLPPTDRKPAAVETPATAEVAAPEGAAQEQNPLPRSPRRRATPIEIAPAATSQATDAEFSPEQLERQREALKPLQVLLGNWKGLSRKAHSDQPKWEYDWVTDPNHPGLRIASDAGVYIRNGRLTYRPESDQFELTTTDAEGSHRTFQGTFIEPIRDVTTDEKKLQRTFKLQLTETTAQPSDIQWRLTFNQQENNRYILEVDRKRNNGPFSRVDTIHTQREGTSFALSESDYGSKTCIISQGLGTISVSYKGQSFWVCCTGCKAAFEEDPEKWIAKWEARKKK
ncbi:hypothetical protein [Schlesneria sp. T3-172]|uniref:hypothetical protein n=1 Tax=Schlesneria sphaerica TaxID=3373610 RepID=UPI0037CC3119